VVAAGAEEAVVFELELELLELPQPATANVAIAVQRIVRFIVFSRRRCSS
jgi:hypothetical protein